MGYGKITGTSEYASRNADAATDIAGLGANWVDIIRRNLDKFLESHRQRAGFHSKLLRKASLGNTPGFHSVPASGPASSSSPTQAFLRDALGAEHADARLGANNRERVRRSAYDLVYSASDNTQLLMSVVRAPRDMSSLNRLRELSGMSPVNLVKEDARTVVAHGADEARESIFFNTKDVYASIRAAPKKAAGDASGWENAHLRALCQTTCSPVLQLLTLLFESLDRADPYSRIKLADPYLRRGRFPYSRRGRFRSSMNTATSLLKHDLRGKGLRLMNIIAMRTMFTLSYSPPTLAGGHEELKRPTQRKNKRVATGSSPASLNPQQNPRPPSSGEKSRAASTVFMAKKVGKILSGCRGEDDCAVRFTGAPGKKDHITVETMNHLLSSKGIFYRHNTVSQSYAAVHEVHVSALAQGDIVAAPYELADQSGIEHYLLGEVGKADEVEKTLSINFFSDGKSDDFSWYDQDTTNILKVNNITAGDLFKTCGALAIGRCLFVGHNKNPAETDAPEKKYLLATVTGYDAETQQHQLQIPSEELRLDLSKVDERARRISREAVDLHRRVAPEEGICSKPAEGTSDLTTVLRRSLVASPPETRSMAPKVCLTIKLHE
ncbi:unnamed protein product [Bathycoccus prasinos]